MHFRNELKYYISRQEYTKLKNIIKLTMPLDSNSSGMGYLIRSLYFDDIFDSALYEKNAGIFARKKFRIRIYDYSDRIIKLERKRKYNNNTNKEDYSLSRQGYDMIMAGDIGFLRTSGNDVALSFYYEYRNLFLRPKVIVDYTREAYIMKAGNVRITFDKELKASSNINKMFEETTGRKIIPEEQLILEVKFDEFLPDIIKRYLSVVDKKPLAISKYVLCRQAIINNEWGLI